MSLMPMPTEPRIRPFEEEDAPKVIALWNRVLADGSPHNDPALAIRKKTEVDDELFFVAEVDSRLVGTVMGGYDGHRGWIYALAVEPEHQRQGIGRALIAHLESALLERGCLKINLQVRASNESVIAFYEKLGYQVEERVSMGKRMDEA